MTLSEWEKGGSGVEGIDIVSLQSPWSIDMFDYVALRSVLQLRLAWALIRVMFGVPWFPCGDTERLIDASIGTSFIMTCRQASKVRFARSMF
jgi:hypothetical protein